MIETLSVPITEFGSTNCAVQVWLPNGYQRGDELYPVIYLLDGLRCFGAQPEESGIMQFMAGWDKEMIVVSIDGAKEESRRRAEYCPFPVTMEDGTIHQGMGDLTIQWILNTLKPIIDDRYRTNPFRLCTAIAGCGMAGTLALYAVSKYNRWFSKAACLSTELTTVSGDMEGMISSCFVDSNTRLFLGWGSEEFTTREEFTSAVGCALQMNRLFVMRESHTYPYQQEGGGQDSESWIRQIPVFMHYLWKE